MVDQRVLAVVLVLLTLAPILVVVIIRAGYSYSPAGDIGEIDLRVREVWSLHPPLVGPYGNHGWDHPGPLLFYLLAVPSLLAGGAAWGTQVGGALLQGVAVVWLAVLAWRRGGFPLLAVAMIGMSLLAHALPTVVVRDPWNPHVALPFFVLFVFQAWVVATGDPRVLPGTVAVGTFLVQTHVGYVPLVGSAALVIVAYRMVDHRRERRARLADPSNPDEHSGANTDRPWRRAVGWSMVLAAVLWLPPILDVVLHPPGNLRTVVGYFLHPERSVLPRLGAERGAGLLAAEFTPLPDWLGRPNDLGFTGLADGRSLIAFLIPVALVVVGLVVARRRRDIATVRILVLATVLTVAGCVALARVEGQTLPYLFLWRPVIAIVVMLGAAWALLAGFHMARGYGRVALAVVAVVIVAWGSGQYAIAVARDSNHDTGSERATASLARQLVRHGVPKRGVILRLQWSSLLQLQRGLYDELSRHNSAVFVDEDLAYQYRDGLARRPHSVARVWWVAESGAALTELTALPGAKLIASWSPLPPRLERRARDLSARLVTEFHALHRSDLDALVDNPFLAFATDNIKGIDHAAARELVALNDNAARRGGPRCGVVSFAPSAAPEGLHLG